MTSHIMRWLTALTLVPLILVLILWGNLSLFTLFIFTLAVLAFWEYGHLVLEGDRLSLLQGLLVITMIMAAAYFNSFLLLAASLSMAVLLFFCVALWGAQKEPFGLTALSKLLLGVFYIGLGLAHFILLWQLPQGIIWIFFVIILGFAGDTFAYYGGRFWGRRRLFPAISPGKTVEGLIALVLGSLLAASVFSLILLPEIPLSRMLVLAFVGGIIGQLGDLAESALKRNAGVKDSGRLFPGHGGVLDRLDCFLFMAPFVYYYLVLVLL